MKLYGFGLTDIGRRRGRNEDSFLVNQELQLYIVADGMGGHSGGEFASRFAVNTIEEVIQSLSQDPEATVISGVNSDEARFGDRLKYAIEVASQKIYDQALFDQELKGMGTTVACILMEKGVACVAHVGDSRVYLSRQGVCKQITDDHSLVSEQLKAGILSEKDVKKHKYKNIITRSVGYQEDVEIDIQYVELQPGDRFMICSDGLSNLVEDNVMAQTLSSVPIQDACRELINKANEMGGDDNITVVVCEAVSS